MENIYILHTNDFHSHLENWPRVRRYIQKRQKEIKGRAEDVFLFDIGDFVDRVHPLTEATNGQANIKILNQLTYDGVTIGNNEGVGNTKEQLNHLYDHAEFDVIVGNLFDDTTKKLPNWSIPYKILKTQQKIKIGILGLTAPFPLSYKPNGWDVCFPQEVLSDLLTDLQSQCDMVILLSHLGIQEDRRIAEQYPEISLIIGSHTHHLFVHGEKVNQTYLAAAGKFGRYTGEICLQVEQKKVQHIDIKVIPTDELPIIPQDSFEILEYEKRGHDLLQAESVAFIPQTLSKEYKARYSMMSVALKAIQEKAGVPVSILNNGLFLTSLERGVVNQDQLHQALPHPMHLLKVTLYGKDMIRLVREMEKNRAYLRNFPIVGMGFRGKIFGEICYDGIRYDAQKNIVYWLEKEIQFEKKYTFITVDHFMFVPFFPTIELMGENQVLFPEFIRTVMGEYLSAHYPIEGKHGIINEGGEKDEE